MKILINVIKKELLLYYRIRSECFTSVLFFIIIAALFPLTININAQQLQMLAPCIIWVSALLATLLSLPQIFRDDFYDGSLAQILLGPIPISFMVLIKIVTHWIVFSVPLLLAAPLLAIMFNLDAWSIAVLLFTLILGTPILHLLGAFVSALTVGLRQSNVLLALVLMPLYVPTLIFACSAVIAAIEHVSVITPLLLLGATLVLTLTFIPIAAAAALRVSVNYS